MTSVEQHYENLLAPIYLWMVGDLELAFANARRQLADAGVRPLSDGRAIDLGAGFGLQSIPLAELGYRVTALDSSARLLDELARLGPALPITTVCDDLSRFSAHVPRPADVIVCMGDTLPHLPSPAAVSALFDQIAAALAPGGRVVLTLRDYTPAALDGTERRIDVRSDENRRLTCVLRYHDDHVEVRDHVEERQGDRWIPSVSSYRKLRLARPWLEAELARCGLTVERAVVERGLVELAAVK